jgi:hypothetical protein
VGLVITLTMLSETKGTSADDEPWLVAVRRPRVEPAILAKVQRQKARRSRKGH